MGGAHEERRGQCLDLCGAHLGGAAAEASVSGEEGLGDVGEVIYDVKRMPDGVQMQTNVAGNSLSVPFTTTTLNKYSFVVTPKAGNREGNGVASKETV